MVPALVKVGACQESGGDGGVGQVYVAAHVPAELFAWANAELGHGEKRRNEACVLGIVVRAVAEGAGGGGRVGARCRR